MMRAYVVLVVAWLIVVGIINPLGNFPLNDDWAFALPVKWLVEKRELAFTDWQFMSLIGQVLVASVVSFATGFSFDVLRFLVLLMALGTALGIAFWSLEKGLSERWASILALTFLLNPIVLNLSSTFMTDVPFTAALVAAVVLLDLSKARSSITLLALGWSAALLACSIRQLGLAVAIAYAVASFPFEKSKPVWATKALVPALAILTLLALYPRVLEDLGILPSMYSSPVQRLRTSIVEIVTLRLGTVKTVIKSGLISLHTGRSPCFQLQSTGRCATWLIGVWRGSAPWSAVQCLRRLDWH